MMRKARRRSRMGRIIHLAQYIVQCLIVLIARKGRYIIEGMQAQELSYATDTMPKLLNFVVDPELLIKLEDFRFRHRFATRAQAIKWLLTEALERKLAPKEPPKEKRGGKTAGK